MKTAILQLDQFDNVLSIKEKLSWSKTQRALLVWPDTGKIDLKPLDVLLILRFAEDLGAQVSIVSDDPVIMMQMKEIGISCFLSIPEAQKKPWRKPKIKKRSLTQRLIDSDRPKPDPESRIIDRHTPISTRFRWFIFMVGLIATLLVVLIFIPSATIKIYPDSMDQNLEMSFHASPSITEATISGSIPASQVIVKVEIQLQGISTGTIRVPSEKASGEVTFSNLSEKEVVIPKGTIIRTSTGSVIRFETTQKATLDAGTESEITVPIICLSSGTTGNVPRASILLIESELDGEVSVVNEKPTNGGVDLKTLSPTDEDYEKLKEDSVNSIKSAAVGEIKNQYPDALLIPTDTMEIIQYLNEERIPEVGFPADQFVLTIDAEVSTWVVQKEDVENLLKSAMEADLSESYKSVDEKIDFHIVNDSILFQNESLWWDVNATRKILPEIDQELLIQKLLGKKIETGKSLIDYEFSHRKEPEITVYPNFWKFLPYLPFQIKLEIHD